MQQFINLYKVAPPSSVSQWKHVYLCYLHYVVAIYHICPSKNLSIPSLKRVTLECATEDGSEFQSLIILWEKVNLRLFVLQNCLCILYS